MQPGCTLCAQSMPPPIPCAKCVCVSQNAVAFAQICPVHAEFRACVSFQLREPLEGHGGSWAALRSGFLQGTEALPLPAALLSGRPPGARGRQPLASGSCPTVRPPSPDSLHPLLPAGSFPILHWSPACTAGRSHIKLPSL